MEVTDLLEDFPQKIGKRRASDVGGWGREDRRWTFAVAGHCWTTKG
jgi:hypothetical protein